MKSFTAALLMSLFFVLLLLQNSEGAPRCTQHDRPPPEKCTYGTVLDWCRNEVCAKGPGETCGGHFWEQGKCGEGTFCSCGTCTGCSVITRRCFRSALVC
ncbi:neuroparsin-A-like [Macrobrachium nipponense]|uniref:Neuroparsin I n=1 Tax=Macrobrachium nipponense TaxID=159736 RepID=A0A6M2RAE6_MACNP|nr:neuroparsin I precursor [Macrobrachium nipponense]